MLYEFSVNGDRYLVEVENHNYRKRFYAKLANSLEDWKNLGYIGSYYPDSKECGFVFAAGQFSEISFEAKSSGPKNAANLCLVAYLTQYNDIRAEV